MIKLFQSNSSGHLKRASVLLQEAQMARIEHQAAAEHHAALAQMYGERVRRLEAETNADGFAPQTCRERTHSLQALTPAGVRA